MSWSGDLVAVLATFKRGGMTFPVAWERALQACPPRGREFQAENAGQLFVADADVDEVDPVEFMRVACEAAWFGESPRQAKLNREMLIGQMDDSRPARGQQRSAA